MTDKEEVVFGAVFNEFSTTRTPPAIVAEYAATTETVRTALRCDLIVTAARTMRALYDLEKL